MTILTPIHCFDDTRRARHPRDRIENVRAAAGDFRRDMLARPKVRYYETFELVRVPYPSRFAYLNAFTSASAYVHLVNRLFVIQFDSDDGPKTLLVSPMDWENQRDTPFFKRLSASAGPLSPLVDALVVKKTATVLDVLARIGLRPEQVDYITYDHMHTVNVRRWLGADGSPALLPNAKLLVMRDEWNCARAPIPWQSQWFCPRGLEGIPEEKVVLLDEDVLLGDGSVAFVRTKGHTEGNHSIVAHTDVGLLVTSENGVSLDAYAPLHSKIPGLAEYARVTGSEVVINGNTLEYAVDQYISMVQEKTIAGPSPEDERIPNMVPSSESDGHFLFPRTNPTWKRGNVRFGRLTSR